ncbi:MAG: class I SAM-dependent methyltransferase [Bdellovibrionota bacterium]
MNNSLSDNCLEGLYKEISEKIKCEINEKGGTLINFNPIKLDFCDDVEAGDLRQSDYLKNVNIGYTYPMGLMNLNNVSTPRKGIVGKVILKTKRRIKKFLVGILDEYLKAEKEQNENIVCFLNEVPRYVDKRDNYIFLELIRKVDSDLCTLNKKIEELADKQWVLEESVQEKLETYHKDYNVNFVNETKARDNHTQIRLNTLFSIVEELERIIKSFSKEQKDSFSKDNNNNNNNNDNNDNDNNNERILLGDVDYGYLFHELKFRGSSKDIKERQRVYIDIIKEIDIKNGDVIDIGAGRGELLELLKENNIDAIGVETDDGMLDVLNEKNLKAIKSDGLSYLKSLKDGEVPCIIALQVVEHLSFDYLHSLINEANRVLIKGGKLILETINPLSFFALTSSFFKDYTHKWPIHPDVLEQFLKLGGFQKVDSLKLSKVPNEVSLKNIEISEFMPPSQVNFVKEYNDNISKLNNLLYGFQDYALIARK